jgi:formamidopyrimidine-DNA glycosylase
VSAALVIVLPMVALAQRLAPGAGRRVACKGIRHELRERFNQLVVTSLSIPALGALPPVSNAGADLSGRMWAMPELPEVEALVRFLDDRTRGRELVSSDLYSIAALKTFDPPFESINGRRALGWTRRGKYLCCDLSDPGDGDLWLVIHLARAGWIKWWDFSSTPGSTKPAPVGARKGRGPIAMRIEFEGSVGFDVTEMGTQKRLAIWVVEDPARIEGVATLGVDPLDPAFTTERLSQILKDESGTVKTVLARQSAIAGIGNAYSDEALHAARLSPFKAANRLAPHDVELLHDAVVEVVKEAADREAGLAASELKGDKKRSMRVHGRTGEKCPVCGDVVREVSFATKSLQYCATCQTGGKPLADRRMSRLLK